MALAKRSNRGASFIWPGFVDGLATVLMVIIFVLMVSLLIQLNLAERVSGQDSTLNRLRGEISELANLLNIERAKSGELAVLNQQLGLDLATSQAEIVGLTGQIDALEESLTEASIREQNLTATLAAGDATVAANTQEIAGLTQALDALRLKLGEVQALLDAKEIEAQEAREASVNLSQRLNDALSSRVAELQRFRSEFFGQLREILQDREDLRIVGDRFVFQSEVLFALGSAEIGSEGEAQLLELSEALREISAKIPTDIDWVLQVSGHTDSLPIRGGRFADNWDLSAERAMAVVRYLVGSGVAPNRLSATGFGEFQPIAGGDTPEALARNRRIEFKITRK